jgi:hypothetical protein
MRLTGVVAIYIWPWWFERQCLANEEVRWNAIQIISRIVLGKGAKLVPN